MIRRPPRSTLFPYTTLFRSQEWSLATRALLRTRTRVLPFISRLPEPLGRVCVYYFRGCQHLWAGPLHPPYILFRGYRLLVPSRLGLITYRIRVQYPLYPVYSVSEVGRVWLFHEYLK